MKTFIILVLAVMVMSAAGLSLRDVLSSAPDKKEDGLKVEKRVSVCNFMVNKNNSCDINVQQTRFKSWYSHLSP